MLSEAADTAVAQTEVPHGDACNVAATAIMKSTVSAKGAMCCELSRICFLTHARVSTYMALISMAHFFAPSQAMSDTAVPSAVSPAPFLFGPTDSHLEV